MAICRVFINTQPVIIVDDDYYEVSVYIEGTKLKRNIGYIIGDYVYVYRGKVKSKESLTLPGIYKKNKKLVIIEPDDKDRNKYHINKVNELSISNIFKYIETNIDKFVQPSDIEVINNNSETFTPTIKSEDDFLKYIIKRAILNKKINLKNYKDRFSNEYALNNMKSGLNKATKMTVPNFIKWCEILGLRWEMRVEDNGEDTINPLTETIVVSDET